MTRPINCGPGAPCTPVAFAALGLLVRSDTPIAVCDRHWRAGIAELRREVRSERQAHPLLRYEAWMLRGQRRHPANRQHMIGEMRAARRRAHPPLRRLP